MLHFPLNLYTHTHTHTACLQALHPFLQAASLSPLAPPSLTHSLSHGPSLSPSLSHTHGGLREAFEVSCETLLSHLSPVHVQTHCAEQQQAWLWDVHCSVHYLGGCRLSCKHNPNGLDTLMWRLLSLWPAQPCPTMHIYTRALIPPSSQPRIAVTQTLLCSGRSASNLSAGICGALWQTHTHTVCLLVCLTVCIF